MRYSSFGADFPADTFIRTPIRLIRRILSELDNREQAEANLASASTAQLCFLVRQAIHIFSHSPGPLRDVDPKAFLPFPNWKPPEDEPTGPSEMTVLVLREALRRREIPLEVFVALISPPENDG